MITLITFPIYELIEADIKNYFHDLLGVVSINSITNFRDISFTMGI